MAGIASTEILTRVAERVRDRGLMLVNLDATIIAQVPRLAEHLGKMKGVIADVLGVDPDRVNVKVTSTDRLGAIGRGEGIAAQVVALLDNANG